MGSLQVEPKKDSTSPETQCPPLVTGDGGGRKGHESRPAKQHTPLPHRLQPMALFLQPSPPPRVSLSSSVSAPPPLPSIPLTSTFMVFPPVNSGSAREIVPKPWCQGPPGPCWSSGCRDQGEEGQAAGKDRHPDGQGPGNWRSPSFTKTTCCFTKVQAKQPATSPEDATRVVDYMRAAGM